MRHPTEGVLRRLLDEPAGVGEPDRRHVVDCPVCLTELAAVREDAARVSAALTPRGAGEGDLDAAWRRLSGGLSGGAAAPDVAQVVPLRTGRSRGLLRRPAAAAVAVGVVLTGAGTAAANDWLPIFRAEQVAPVRLTTADLVALPDLSAYGELAVTGEPDVHEVADARAAAAETGLDVPDVTDLPRGVSGEPQVQVGSKATATFTFSAERAARAADEAGEALPDVPPGLDGSRVRLVAGPGVAQVWESSAGAPALLVGRAVAPSASSSGARYEVVRDYLLTLPGLPDDLAAQLRTFTADGSTLPLPVPADQVSSSPADVGGVPATVLAARDGSMAAVVWVDEGVLTAVAGSMDGDEVLTIARALR